MKEKWFIRLGALEWSRYTSSRMNSDALKLLGSVRKGPQMGALAQTPDGFVQINGEFITKLNTSQIRCALAKVNAAEVHETRRPARRTMSSHPSRDTPSLSTPTAPKPVVVVKRRRSFVMPSGAGTGGATA